MKLLDLPLDVIRYLVRHVVCELGLRDSMNARLVCRLFADEMLDAVITTKTIEDVDDVLSRLVKIDHHHHVIARYLRYRLSTEKSPSTSSIVYVVRQTREMLVQITGSGNDLAKQELIEWNACACLAAHKASKVFPDKIRGEPVEKCSGSIRAHCLTLAAWMGDFDLVKSLHEGSDCMSTFGRPSWAAAAQGNSEIFQYCLDRGAQPYCIDRITDVGRGRHKQPLAMAAYMGHANIVQLCLQLPTNNSSLAREVESVAIDSAAEANQVRILKTLLEHNRARADPHEYLANLDYALVSSCKRGALDTAKLALEYGADPNETDNGPRSCLQLAAISGSAPIVKMLLDAGAFIEATSLLRRRSWNEAIPVRKHTDALKEAKKRSYPKIVRLIEEAKVARQNSSSCNGRLKESC